MSTNETCVRKGNGECPGSSALSWSLNPDKITNTKFMNNSLQPSQRATPHTIHSCWERTFPCLAAPGMGLRSITAPMVSSGTLWENSVHSSACDRANGCLSLLKQSEQVPGWLRLACAALQGCFPLSPGDTSTERALQAHFPCSNTRVSNRDSHRN